VVEAHDLRDELIRRFAIYSRRPRSGLARRTGITPV